MEMIKVALKPNWASMIGGSNSDYFYDLWDKEGTRPYFDATYWMRVNFWIEKTYNCKIVETEKLDINGRPITIKSHFEFENESDATMFLLRWN
jgi:hypothetical protein